MAFSRPALLSQNFVTLCQAEDNISANNNGNKVTPNDIAKRLAALWVRSCSKLHPAVTSRSWAEVNVGRVLPLDHWLDDTTDLLLMCASPPSPPPCLSIPNVHTGSPDQPCQLKLACQRGLSTPAPPQSVRYLLLKEKHYPVTPQL